MAATNIFNFKNTYCYLPNTLFKHTLPAICANPNTIIFNSALANQLGINTIKCDALTVANIFSGSQILTNSNPIATAYAGHQFGGFNMLGDGRAILLGEHITPLNTRYDIQLKGSGRTTYSRGGDGKATLKAMLREYVMSECLHAMHIPTTRSLAVVATGENIYRDPPNNGAVLTRVAASHIRVGTFEYLRRFESLNTLTIFFNYTLYRHYPELINSDNIALDFLQAVMQKQIALVVNWMRVGFIHGVMNTDNTSICGETIDYGPCAFINSYNPNTVFSSIDTNGRYAFGNQPNIIQWNLTRLAECLLPLIDTNTEVAVQKATEVLNKFTNFYSEAFYNMMANKLGIINYTIADNKLIDVFLQGLTLHKADYTNSFLHLEGLQVPYEKMYAADDFLMFKKTWLHRIGGANNLQQALTLMRKNNAIIIPRNHIVEKALDLAAINNDLSLLNNLLTTINTTHKTTENITYFITPPTAHFEANYNTFCGT